ncbi:hypothetical protein Q4530_08185 [Colwellia sp. 1_MG-2023]|uniref:hypothetical protein n=1 Tax=unclassified Colwellia TaxID=196834 RepID=UPI001C096BBE|nr:MULTISPECIES: hypothetical protein [unclassified Colwellia]MBU2924836.1 hypothetical protein [Colwellia sp. C2M11]MDO6654070.1 hypothetical protein [Colwellia sp. 3_MG-2023]MDO6665488.1 hypothetical protein [Colwellia sp. 2_MG-2023]MDO6689753.1 hypothetical protein [Colwellia sp. 1_MG-2023]
MKRKYLFIIIVYIIAANNPKSLASDSSIADNIISISSGVFFKSYQKNSTVLQGDICQNLQYYSFKKNIDRLLIDMKVTCLAFKELGLKLNIDLIPFPNILRAIAMVELGKVDTIAPTVWQSLINKSTLHSSIEVIRKGEYEKGIYVNKNHPLLSLPSNEIDLNNYTGITLSSWPHDLEILNQLTSKIAPLSHVPSLPLMLKYKRADFMLSDFPNLGSLNYQISEMNIVPMAGMKVIIYDSRHFIVTNKTENGDRYYKYLNEGLKALRNKGIINKTYAEMGFNNKQTENWQILNAEVK